MSDELRVNDVKAIEVVREHGEQAEVVGFAVLLRDEKWVAINTILPDPLVGVYGTAHEAFVAIRESEKPAPTTADFARISFRGAR